MGNERFLNQIFEDFPGTESIFVWIRICIKVQSGSGTVRNFSQAWIQIRIKMIRISHTA